MSKFIIQGGKTLQGIYKVSGAKNAGPKLPIAALLSKEKCIFHNIPRISDTYKTIETLKSLGAEVKWIEKNSLEVKCSKIISSEIPLEAMSARQSVLFIGAVLARTGQVSIYFPKGDAIGKRPLNRHLEGIKALGGQIMEKNNHLKITMPIRPNSVIYTFEKNTHCGTENLILASVFNNGKVVLKNAAEEPEVDNLIETLNQMGARIKRIENRVIEIQGVEPFLHSVEISSMFDRLESATALVLSVMHGGQIVVENIQAEFLQPFLKILQVIGVEIIFEKNFAKIIKINYPLKPADIITAPHPGFVTDWQPPMTLLLAYLAKGKSLIHEKVFETRWRYLEELKKMGLQYELFHPASVKPEDYNFNNSEYNATQNYAAYIYGSTNFQAAELDSHDVRAGMNMLLASLVAQGESIINDPQGHIDRGYENVVDKLKSLGADIARV